MLHICSATTILKALKISGLSFTRCGLDPEYRDVRFPKDQIPKCEGEYKGWETVDYKRELDEAAFQYRIRT